MKFSENELKNLFNGKLNITTEELCHKLTMLGLEIEGCEPVAADFTGVFVGEILNTVQHPNADRLKVCTVSLGREPKLQIVCGGVNARAGIKVAVSVVGACLPGDFKIKESELRGVLSQGMLCSEEELGLPKTTEIKGIMELPSDAPLGMNLREYLDLDDHIIEINLTPNRADCLSLYGIAREIAVLNQLPLPEVLESEKPTHASYFLAELEDIDNTVKTPIETIKRLERSGIRTISPVVDILNEVMILTGQPMHAFDADKIEGDISIDFAKAEEKIELLNDETIRLRANTLTIRDAKGPVAIAGIMGDKPSSVTESTKRILIESAFFDPAVIAGRARSYGLHTDSSHRFERGVDPTLAPRALALAIKKLKDSVGVSLKGIQEKAQTKLPAPAEITLSLAKVKKLLGVEISETRAKSYLIALGCKILKESEGKIQIKAPSWRFDFAIEEDLIEELARLEGYDNIPLQIPQMALQQGFSPEAKTTLARIKDFLVAEGLHEVVSYSFIDEEWQKRFFSDEQYKLTNPITKELTSMRKSLVPSHLSILEYNLNRQQNGLCIFEMGERFVGIPSQQISTLAGLLYGKQIDFYRLKGLVEKLGQFARLNLQFKTDNLPGYLHPGQAQSVWFRGQCVGYFGAMHPQFANAFVFELDGAIFDFGTKRQAKAISKFPFIERDLAFLVERTLPAEKLIQAAKSIKIPILQDVSIFDVYAGERLPSEQKSIAIKLKLQAQDRTLIDEEVDRLISEVVAKIKQSCNATLREG